jgi:hypothetical protein
MRIISLFVLLSVLFNSCTSADTTVWWENEDIEKEIKTEIKNINDTLVHSIYMGDVDVVKKLLSDVLLEKSPDMDDILFTVSGLFTSEKYRILDEYYVKNSTTDITNTILSGDGNYLIHYKALNKEVYVSLLAPESGDDELLITIVYGKYEDGWKINILRFGHYTINKKTALDYYEVAREYYSKSYLVDALNNMLLSIESLEPADDVFKYRKSDEIKEFSKKMKTETEAAYNFPLSLEEIDTKPQVFNIYPQRIDEGFFPMVLYLSAVNIDDTVALKKEYQQIKSVIGDYFAGIDKDKKYIFYRAFNELPQEDRKVDNYGFVDQLTQ